MGYFPNRWLQKQNQKKVSIREDHFSTHGSAVDLQIVAIIKREIVHCENHANEVTKCAIQGEWYYERKYIKHVHKH